MVKVVKWIFGTSGGWWLQAAALSTKGKGFGVLHGYKVT